MRVLRTKEEQEAAVERYLAACKAGKVTLDNILDLCNSEDLATRSKETRELLESEHNKAIERIKAASGDCPKTFEINLVRLGKAMLERKMLHQSFRNN